MGVGVSGMVLSGDFRMGVGVSGMVLRGDFRMGAGVLGMVLSFFTCQGLVRLPISASFTFTARNNYEKQCLFAMEKIHTNLLTEIFFPIAFCTIYLLFYHFHILR